MLAYLSDKDTSTHRVCGTCGKLKGVDEFYRDGKDSENNPRYRRDCKDCYKDTRIKEAVVKMKKKGGRAL
jgi:hypothetical protein